MLWGKKKDVMDELADAIENAPVEQSPPDELESVRRLNSLQNRRRAMVREICEKLLKPTRTLKMEWSATRDPDACKNIFSTSIACGHRIELHERIGYIEVKLWDIDWNGPKLLNETLSGPIHSLDAVYNAAADLVSAIKQQPVFLERKFKEIMDDLEPEDKDVRIGDWENEE